MSKSLLDQADALMRRRSFVAGAGAGNAESEEQPGQVQHSPDSAVEDVPVLTEEVAAHAAQSPDDGIALRIELAMRQRVAQLLVDRQAQLAQEIEAWLDEQMPQLVIRAMDGITDHLVALLANRAKDELLPRLEAALKPPDMAEADADSEA